MIAALSREGSEPASYQDLAGLAGRRPVLAAALDQAAGAIRRILEHLGLSTPQGEKPAPVRDVAHVAEPGDGWGVPKA